MLLDGVHFTHLTHKEKQGKFHSFLLTFNEDFEKTKQLYNLSWKNQLSYRHPIQKHKKLLDTDLKKQIQEMQQNGRNEYLEVLNENKYHIEKTTQDEINKLVSFIETEKYDEKGQVKTVMQWVDYKNRNENVKRRTNKKSIEVPKKLGRPRKGK
tara:strand:+ start:483 stop:944 length:462 start_codon:yes stop_codon:yes gene_type:complete